MIQVFTTLKEILHARSSRDSSASIGFVPTMGNLHQGHLRLLQEGLKHHEQIFLSIFVNPKQFGPQEDFLKYPRTLEEDLNKISTLLSLPDYQGKDVFIFAPKDVEEIFPPGFSSSISVGEITKKFCGKSRPGHFDGVTTVVYQLFSLISPHTAYFGQKDFQQVLVIKKMIQDLSLPVQIKMIPTVRQENGLALSSRNQYLNTSEQEKALVLFHTLKYIADLIGKESWQKAKEKVQEFISQTLQDSAWEYLEVCQQKDLSPPADNTHQLVILGAFRLGKTRLIDNILIN